MTESGAEIPLCDMSTATAATMSNLIVAMPDLTELVLPICKATRATEVMEDIINCLSFDIPHARHALSLWIMSPDLELQLKPNHCPLQLIAKWPVYLRKYTELSPSEIESQTPKFALRRNVFMSRDYDQTISDPGILHLLFCEARLNVLDSSYPISIEFACKLAGILATMQYGPYNATEHDHHFYKHSSGLVPTGLQDHSKLFSQSCDFILFEHKNSNSITQADPQAEAWITDLTKAFLKQAMEIPYYGCVFFSGFIERSKKTFLQDSYLPVTIGLNTDGLYLIDAERKEAILGVLYPDLKWEFIKVSDCNKEASPHSNDHSQIQQIPKRQKGSKFDSTPSIILQYPTPAEEHVVPPSKAGNPTSNEPTHTSAIRVFTKSARMIDAFIETCGTSPSFSSPPLTPHDAAAGDHPALDSVDGAPAASATLTYTAASHQRLTLKQSISSIIKPDKLVCLEFDENGVCIS